jgi:DNA-binding CsgD family transcriptional regulator
MAPAPRGVPLVGRDADVDVLCRMLGDVAAGQGGVAWVEGEPGVGKSALLSEALAGAPALGCQLYAAAADEAHQRFPLRVMLECLRIDTAADDWRVAELADVVRAESRSDVGWVGDPLATASERLLGLVEERCAVSPVVIAVDDLQWADEASFLVWHRLGRLAAQVPLLLVAACRPLSRRAELATVRRQVLARDGALLKLGGLPEAAVTELLTGLLGAAPGTALRRFVDHAAGNPLYVRELTEALVREGMVLVEGGTAELAGSPYEAPRSLSSVIARRLDALSSSASDLLRSAALLGNEFAVTDLATLVERVPADLLADLSDAIAAGVVVEAGDRLAFRHPLVRRALYRTIPATARAARHRRAARMLAEVGAPIERVAEQLLNAPTPSDSWLARWLAYAVPTLTYRAPHLAVDLLTHVVEHLPVTDPDRESLAVHLVNVLFRIERNAEAEKWTREVLVTTTDPERVARMRWCLGYVRFRTGRLELARDEVWAALRDPALPPLWRARLQALLATIFGCGFGNVAATEEAAQRTLDLAEEAADRFAAAHALSSFFFVHSARREYARALAAVDRGLSFLGAGREYGDMRAMLLDERVFTLQNLDRLDEAEDTLRAARRLADESGEVPATRLHVAAAIHAFWLGRWDDAMADLTAAADNLPELTSYGLQSGWPVLLMHGVAALIAGHRGDRAASAAHLRQGHGQPMTSAADIDNCDFLVAAGALALQSQGRAAEALAMFAPYLDPDHGQTLLKHQWLPGAVRLALDLGDVETARAATFACEAEAAEGDSPRSAAAVERCRAILDNDPDRLLAAAEHYRQVGRRFEYGQTVEDAAVAFARAGSTAAARASLVEAIRVSGELGAAWDIRRADERLRGYGVRRGGNRRPRRRPMSGWDSLSATELTIARLVAEARSNPDIAAALFLSRRTVQTHVSHIMVKLGARSRVEIAKEAVRHPD